MSNKRIPRRRLQRTFRYAAVAVLFVAGLFLSRNLFRARTPREIEEIAWLQIVQNEKDDTSGLLPAFGAVDARWIQVGCSEGALAAADSCRIVMNLDGGSSWEVATPWKTANDANPLFIFKVSNSSAINTRHYFRAELMHKKEDRVSHSGITSIRNSRVCSMTPGLNASSIVAFTLASILPAVNKAIYIDTASEDQSVDLIETVLAEEVSDGRLVIVPMRLQDLPPVRWDSIGLLRQIGIGYARLADCQAIIKVDADEVFSDWGAMRLARRARQLPSHMLSYWVPSYELFQNTYVNATSWVRGLEDAVIARHEKDPPIFQKMMDNSDGRFWNQRIYSADDCQSRGKWLDEVSRRPPEGFVCIEKFDHRMGDMHLREKGQPFLCHYGWAREFEYVVWKHKIWHGMFRADLHEDYPHPKQPFVDHPETILRRIKAVREWIEKRDGARGR